MTEAIRTLRHLSPALLLALSVAACGGDKGATGDTGAAAAAAAPAAASDEVDEDLQDITKYELSMDKIDKLFAAQRNIALKAKALSPAEREAMKAKDDASDDANASLDDMARKIEGHPLMSSAVREAGLSPREYAMLTVSMVQTAMAAAVLDMRPNDNRDSLVREMKANPANIRFYQEHKAELERKQAEFQAEMKRLGVDDEG